MFKALFLHTRFLIVVPLLFALHLLSPQPSLPQSVEDILRKGDEYHKESRAAGTPRVRAIEALGQAIKEYEAALKSEDGSYEVLWRLARARRERGELYARENKKDVEKSDYLTSERYARKAIEVSPRGDEGHAQMSMAIGRVALSESPRRKIELSKDVKAYAEKALELNPNHDIAHHIVGRWNYEYLNITPIERFFANLLFGSLPYASYDDAVKHLQKAVEINPAHVEHHYEFARALIKVERYAEAREHLTKAMELPAVETYDPEIKENAKRLLKEIERKR